MDFASHSRRRRTSAGTLPLRSLHRCRRCTGGPVAEFPVMHLRRRSSEWVAFILKVTAIGVELLDRQSGDLWWSLDFRDVDNPAIILLADNTGKRNTENNGFILCPLYGRKCKAFVAGIGASNSIIISRVTKTARSTVGLSLSVDTSQSLTIIDFIKRSAKEAVGADETPYGGWSVMRLRSAAHGTAKVMSLSLGIGPEED